MSNWVDRSLLGFETCRVCFGEYHSYRTVEICEAIEEAGIKDAKGTSGPICKDCLRDVSFFKCEKCNYLLVRIKNDTVEKDEVYNIGDTILCEDCYFELERQIGQTVRDFLDK